MTSGAAPTWARLLADTAAQIGDHQHARWLCEEASGSSIDEFVGLLDTVPTEPMVLHLDAMIGRYRAGEPIQYVLGSWGFRGLDLAVDQRVLIPRPETELVVDVALELLDGVGPSRRVADLGTGSGAIGLALAAELPLHGTTVVLTDVSPAALDVASANLAGIGRAAVNVRLALGSWADALGDDRFDLIVSNPPYVADADPEMTQAVTSWEPHLALFAGPDGLDAICEIVTSTTTALRPGGWLVLEIGAAQGARVAALAGDAGLVGVEVRPDLSGRDRIVVAQRPDPPLR
jgi:release factor glutamine methyltransferase